MGLEEWSCLSIPSFGRSSDRQGASSGRGAGRRRHFRTDAAIAADDLAEGLAGPLTIDQAAASPAVVSVSVS